jgi:TPP-dependent 2-oxoacid decarboxylase
MDSLADFLVKRLKEQSIQTIFTSQGTHHSEFFRKLEEDDMSILECMTDEEAIISANGYSKIKNTPSCVILSFNTQQSIVNGLSTSFLENIPILLINLYDCDYERNLLKLSKENYLNKTIESLRGSTRSQEKIIHSELAESQIDLSIEKLLLFQQPIYIETSAVLLSKKTSSITKERIKRKYWGSCKQTLEKASNFLMENLKEAKNPLILAGYEIRSNNNTDLFEKFIKQSKIKYLTTCCSKSMISEENENFCGVFSGNKSNNKVLKLFKESDLVVYMGVHVTEIDKLKCSLLEVENKSNHFIYVYGSNLVDNNLNCFKYISTKDILIKLCHQNDKLTKNESLKIEPKSKRFDENSENFEKSNMRIENENKTGEMENENKKGEMENERTTGEMETGNEENTNEKNQKELMITPIENRISDGIDTKEKIINLESILLCLEKYEIFENKIIISDCETSIKTLEIKSKKNNYFNQLLFDKYGYSIKSAIGIQMGIYELELNERILIFIDNKAFQTGNNLINLFFRIRINFDIIKDKIKCNYFFIQQQC